MPFKPFTDFLNQGMRNTNRNVSNANMPSPPNYSNPQVPSNKGLFNTTSSSYGNPDESSSPPGRPDEDAWWDFDGNGFFDIMDYINGQNNEDLTPQQQELLSQMLLVNNFNYDEAEYDRKMALMDKIGEMTTPWSTYGTLGETIVDAEGKKVTQTLSPELQAQYDALLG